jgi:glutathione synthase/RimK-type ligase-like ATP-grasp enzyme
MKIAILTSISLKAANQLADHLRENNIEADVFQPTKKPENIPANWKGYDYIFKYGSSYPIPNGTFGKGRDKVINNTEAVRNCVDKWETFRVFRENNIPTVRHWNDPTKVPLDVETIVIRDDRKGNGAKGFAIHEREGKPLPKGELYTEYFYYNYEYRVYVFKGKAFVYYKHWDEGYHNFRLTKNPRAKKMAEHAIKAAAALNIDFVSFDVVARNLDDYAFLEANSGSILADEVSEHIVTWFLNQ